MHYRRIVQIALVMLVIMVSGVASAQDAEKTYKIGSLLWYDSQAFISKMTELGYTEGQNITYMILSYENVAPEDYQKAYTEQVQAMVDAKVDVFVVSTDTEAVNLKPMVGNIPIVFCRSDDPIATGAVKDLVTPGGQITGGITNRHHERRLQLLTEIKPSTKKVYYLYSTQTGEAEAVLQQVKAVAKDLGVEVIPAPMTDGPSGVEALKNTPDDVDWLFTTPYVPFMDPQFVAELTAASMSHKIGIAFFIDQPIKDYVIGYGPNIQASDGQAATQVDRILRGANPADLPVQTIENYLVVNLEAAQSIGLDIPVNVLRQAETIVRPGYFDNRDANGNLITPTPEAGS
jgi:putative ABC transport system substrate-binding protein